MLRITNFTLYSAGQPNSPGELASRCVTIALSTGEEVTVVGCYGGYEQYGALPNCYETTQPVAEHYTQWLNGGAKPKPYQVGLLLTEESDGDDDDDDERDPYHYDGDEYWPTYHEATRGGRSY